MRHLLFAGLLLWLPVLACATPQQLYEQAMATAAAGGEQKAIATLQDAEAMLPAGDIWRQRMVQAASLMQMRQGRSVELAAGRSMYAQLSADYLKEHAAPEARSSWVPGVLATVFPGAGHAFQGRWRDALTAAVMVWPMLILTLWAAYRRMGPVTLFFAMITAWLWSGTIFSAISLAERSDLESYLLWWQGLWQASALPGRPW